jgi:hypothetical protein
MHRKMVFLGFSSYFFYQFSTKKMNFLNYIPLLKINRIGKLSENCKKNAQGSNQKKISGVRERKFWMK